MLTAARRQARSWNALSWNKLLSHGMLSQETAQSVPDPFPSQRMGSGTETNSSDSGPFFKSRNNIALSKGL